ncbi:MAG: ABC transporter permease [Thermomicrobiales bacterium]|nr:ABC transporter permease [Thermomicrobiales bacterium]
MSSVFASPQENGWQKWKAVWARNEALSLLVLLAGVIALFMVIEPTMRKSSVYWDLLRQVSPTMVAAVGITLLLLSGEFDLTVGSMLALTGIVIVDTFNRTDNMWLGILAGLLTGLIIGAINGTFVTVIGMESLMTTLGMMFAIRGLVYVYTNQTPIVDQNRFTQFTRLWFKNFGPVPSPIIVALVLVALAYFLATRTEFGRNTYAIGGNANAARVSGINVRRVKFTLFVISGLMASVAGLLYTAQTDTGYFNAGLGFELEVLAAVVLGGASLAGGQGNVTSTALAVLIIGTIGKGMRLMSIDTTQQLLVIGIVMLIAVYYHRIRKQTAARLTQEAYAARQAARGNVLA